MRAVVVSPHLDDAVLSAAAVLGPGTLVVTVFAGIPRGDGLGWWDAESGASSSRERMRQRRAEDVAALARFGARGVHLRFLGRQYTGALSGGTTARIAAALRRHLDGAPRVYAPVGLGHPEHVRARDAVLRVHADATLYADLPYAVFATPGLDALPDGLDGRVRCERTLSPAVLRRKMAAARCYASQIPALEDLFGDCLTDAVLGREVYWEPAPASARRGGSRR